MNHKITVSWKLKPIHPNKKQPTVEYSVDQNENFDNFPLYISILFETKGALSLDETTKAVSLGLRKSTIGWIWFANGSWFIDLDRLREEFSELRGEIWLRGVISIQPRFGSLNILSFDDDDEFANLLFFYINPDIATKGSLVQKAPVEITDSLSAFRKDHPKPRENAFIMMRFNSGGQNASICNSVREALRKFNIDGLRADDKTYHDDLFWNIMTYIYGCGLGIAVYERIESESFNPNVSLEVGYMLALGKPVCLLKDKTLKTLHSDLIGKLYQPFDVFNPSTSIPLSLHKWLEDKGYQK